MKRKTPFSLSLIAALCCLVAGGCSDEERVVGPTQITARIYVEPAVRERLASLHVQSAAETQGGWVPNEGSSFGTADLNGYPVDIVFVPRPGTSSTKQIEIVVEARDADNQPLAQERAIVRFVRHKQRVLELWLGACGSRPLGTLCDAAQSCHGPNCLSCVGGECGLTPVYGEDALLPLDPNARLDPDKPRPTSRTSGGATVLTCAVPSAMITCDDGNPCNGREACEPGKQEMSNGCALVEPEVECSTGSICNSDTGRCESCADRSDGDRDTFRSDACEGGDDCDDNDAQTFPGSPELCDGKDNDCSGVADDGAANDHCARLAGPNAGGSCVMGRCVMTGVPVTLSFAAELGEQELACGRSYLGVGRDRSTVSPVDLRFYVQEVSLIGDDGRPVRIELDERAPFQTKDVALLDFTGADGECTAASPMVNTTLTGRVPAGSYRGVELVIGVPEGLNHADPMVAPPPLQVAGAHRGDRLAGYRFLIAELGVGDADGPVEPRDAGPGDAGVRDGGAPTARRVTGVVQLASGGCMAGASGAAVTCAQPNRARIRLTNFDHARQRIVLDVNALFAGLELAGGPQCLGTGPVCERPYRALGIGEDGQSVFRVE